jgi:antitoxin (DNA-binding transcriptional repressor) of toxin-antitoxin stability system
MTVTIHEAHAWLPEIIANLSPGEEVIITRDGHAVASLIAEPKSILQPRQPGNAKGQITFMNDDFDAPLEDFEEYMG